MDIEKVKTLLSEIVSGRGMVKDTSTCLMGTPTQMIPKLLSYGEVQDKAREALAELEKPAEDDAMDIAERILNDCDGTRNTLSIAVDYLQQFAESYHAKKCAEYKRRDDSVTLKSFEAPFCTRIWQECHARNGVRCMHVYQCSRLGALGKDGDK